MLSCTDHPPGGNVLPIPTYPTRLEPASSDVINYDIVLQLATPSPPLPSRLPVRSIATLPFSFFLSVSKSAARGSTHATVPVYFFLFFFFSSFTNQSRRINPDSLNHAHPAFSPETLDRSASGCLAIWLDACWHFVSA